jgi:hypothetical protein
MPSLVRPRQAVPVATPFEEFHMAMNKMFLASAVLAAACVPAAAHAQAFLDMTAQGPGVCQAALPAYEGQVRKRPLAIQNEGTVAAFVTCAIPQFTNPALNDPEYGVGIFLINNGATAATVACTGVSIGNEGVVYVPQTVEVPANSGIDSEVVLSWDEVAGDGSAGYTTTSCSLPPGTGISFVSSLAGPVSVPVE